MRLIGWAKSFEHYQAIADVPEQVRKVEKRYWFSLCVSVVIMVAGIGMMMQSDRSNWGLFFAMTGCINIALIKIWAHIRLAFYQMLLEVQARERK